jgi:hypothetical protein
MLIVFWILLGLVSAIAFLSLIRLQPERETQSLAIGLVVAAIIYVIFALTGGANGLWLAIEIAGIGIYSVLALLGWRFSILWLMLGWLAHPLWDISLHISDGGAKFTPAWYVIACVSFDLLTASYIAGKQLKLNLERKGNEF